MVEYLKTNKGYFYKLKNGEKKRISQKEYKNKNKKMIGGGEPVEKGDIMYEDNLVRILKPDVKKGIIVWTHYTQPPGKDSLCEMGLKTGEQLKSEGVEFGRTKIHPYIYFRAPYYSRDIDYSSPETEIKSSYGEGQIGKQSRIFIRVDPDRTFVFSSEIRDTFKHQKWQDKEETIINNSKKSLSKYLEIINDNIKIEKDVKSDKKIWYNLFTSKSVLFPIKASPSEPFDLQPINKNSEILVSIPHLTPDYFVLCTPEKLKTNITNVIQRPTKTSSTKIMSTKLSKKIRKTQKTKKTKPRS